MDLGALRNLARIQRSVGAPANAIGEVVPAWQHLSDAWCSIEPLSGRELEIARQVEARVTTRITMRYVRGLAPAMRVLWRDGDADRIFELVSVLDTDQLHDEHVCLAVESV